MATEDRPRFKCGSCGQRYGWTPELAGRTVRCQCGTTIRIPTEVSSPKPVMPPPVGPTRTPAPVIPQPRDELAAVLGLEEGDGAESVEGVRSAAGHAKPVRTKPEECEENGSCCGGDSEHGVGGSRDTWKWWYYVVAGVLIGALSIYDLINGGEIIRLGRGRGGPAGGLLLSALCVTVGIFSRPRKKA